VAFICNITVYFDQFTSKKKKDPVRIYRDQDQATIAQAER